MKKGLAYSIISILAVAAIALGVLYFTNNNEKSNQIALLDADITTKEGKIEGLIADIDDKENQIKELSADNAEQAAQIEALNADITLKANQIEKQALYISEKEKQIDTLNSDLTYRQEQIEELNAIVIAKESEIESLNLGSAEKSAQIDALKAEIEENESKISTLQNELQQMYHDISNFKSVASKDYRTIAMNYFEGDGVRQDFTKAMEFYQKAAELGDAAALNAIGDMYSLGLGTEKNDQTAFEYYMKAADAGDPQGIYNVGLCYETHRGVAKNQSTALKYYKQAADLGVVDAMNKMADYYSRSNRYSDAIDYYQKAADTGNAYALRRLGDMYFIGATKTNYALALDYYRKAAEKGDQEALISLGDCYYYGTGVDQNYSMALGYYQKVNDLQDAEILSNIADCYYNGIGTNVDYEKAFEYYQKAAEFGNTDAEFYLGYMFYLGRGTTKDYSKAFEHYLIAAEAGSSAAYNNIGVMYANGYGVREDDARALEYYYKAANLGSAMANKNIGVCYENGDGTEKSDSKALLYYQKAASQGNEDAKSRYDKLLDHMKQALDESFAVTNDAQGRICLDWSEVKDAEAYIVQRSRDADLGFSTIATVTDSLSYCDETAISNTENYYKIIVRLDTGFSYESKAVSASLTKSGLSSVATTPLSITRIISPEVVRSGAQVTVTYDLYNNGSVELTDIRLQEKISRAAKSVESLPAGQHQTVTFTTRIGNADLISSAIITYKVAGSSETVTESVPEATISLAKIDTNDGGDSLKTTDTVYLGGNSPSSYTRKTSYSAPHPDQYTYYPMGVVTFRGDNFRRNAAYGKADVVNEQLTILWKSPIGSLRTADNGTLYGVGWTGQPAIVKWTTEVRQMMNLYEDKKEAKALTEVIFGAQDGKIYFLDLNDGTATRDPISVGYPLRGSVSIDSWGRPLLAVGQSLSKLPDKTGSIGLHLFNLIDGKEAYLLNGRKSDNQIQYNTNGAFDGTALFLYNNGIDALIVAGENGLLYTIDLNSKFVYPKADDPNGQGSMEINPFITYLCTKSGSETDTQVGVESSVAMYDKYIYMADTFGVIRCVDSDTMKTVWAVDGGDNIDASIALDMEGSGVSLYTGNTAYSRLGSKNDVTIRKLNALTGETQWTYAIKCTYDKSQLSGCKASPIIGQNSISDLVIFTVNKVDGGGSKILALSKDTGKLAWECALTAETVSSPVAVYNDNGDAWIIQGDEGGNLTLLNARTGNMCTTLNLGGTIQGSPAVYKNTLVVGTCSKDNAYMYGVRID